VLGVFFVSSVWLYPKAVAVLCGEWVYLFVFFRDFLVLLCVTLRTLGTLWWMLVLFSPLVFQNGFVYLTLVL